MPLPFLLKLKGNPTDFRKKQLLNSYKHYCGLFVRTKDPESKRKLARTGWAIQLQLINFGIRLRKPAKWNAAEQWRLLQGKMRRRGLLRNAKGSD